MPGECHCHEARGEGYRFGVLIAAQLTEAAALRSHPVIGAELRTLARALRLHSAGIDETRVIGPKCGVVR